MEEMNLEYKMKNIFDHRANVEPPINWIHLSIWIFFPFSLCILNEQSTVFSKFEVVPAENDFRIGDKPIQSSHAHMCGGLLEPTFCRDSKSKEKAICLSKCHFLCNFGFHHF